MIFEMKRNKLKIIVLIAVIALIAVGAVLYFLHPEWFMTKEKEKAWRLEQETKVAEIIRSGDASACNGVNYKGADGTDYQIVCLGNVYYNEAKSKLDISFCQKFLSESKEYSI